MGWKHRHRLQLSNPGRYFAISQAYPGVLTPPHVCIHLTTESKTCRCIPRLGQSGVSHWMDWKQQTNILPIAFCQPAPTCVHPQACKICAPLLTHSNTTTTSPLHIWHFCVQATLISGKQRSIERPRLYSKHITDVFALQLKQGQSCTLTRALKRHLCLKYQTRLWTAMQTNSLSPTKGYDVFRAVQKMKEGNLGVIHIIWFELLKQWQQM